MSDLLTRLGASVLLHRSDLIRLIRTAPIRYKVYQIEKRVKGQFRTIAQPAREVKVLQRWVMKNVLSRYEVHAAATAYRKNISILRNARPHSRGRFLLKMDFKDFFPSLSAADFRAFLAQVDSPFDAEEVEALCHILFWMPKTEFPKLCLSIGAPASPMLSNILMVQFDRDISSVCADAGVAYTRYADDLSFSAADSERLRVVEEAVLAWCARTTHPTLTVNQAKTVRVSRADSRRVTGLVLTNDRKVSLGRDMKRLISARMHYFVTGRLTSEDIIKLRGMLAYVNSVEAAFLDRLREKYGAEAVRRCMQYTAGP